MASLSAARGRAGVTSQSAPHAVTWARGHLGALTAL